jgi:hypothetical protein
VDIPHAWRDGKRFLISAWSYVEPFRVLAKETSGGARPDRWEAVGARGVVERVYTPQDGCGGAFIRLVTQNCEDHVLLRLMHRPDKS